MQIIIFSKLKRYVSILVILETWTPERIAQSFPITVDSCRKLLKSKWVPRTLEVLARHDDKVIENWKALSEVHPELEGEFKHKK